MTTELSSQLIRQLVRRAKAYAQAKGFAQDADDFAQEYAIERLSGRNNTQIKHFFIDYLRRVYASKGGDALAQLEKRALAFPKYDSALVASGSRAPVLTSDVEKYFKGMPPMTRAVFFLAHYWGFSVKEIGDCFGLSDVWAAWHLMQAKDFFYKNKAWKEDKRL